MPATVRTSWTAFLPWSLDSPLARSRRYFDSLGVDLDIDELAAALIAERASHENRTGARALRDVFSEIVNPLEFDFESEAKPSARNPDRSALHIDADRVRRMLR